MRKQYKSVLEGLLNGSGELTTKGGGHAHLAESRAKAYEAMRSGLKVFMTKETVAGFEAILKTKPTSHIMRSLLADIACGKIALTPARKPVSGTQLCGTVKTKPVAIPVVMSVDQLSAGIPFSLKQASKILNVTANKLYARCAKGRIHFERDGSRYLIPASEVQRLQVVGLF